MTVSVRLGPVVAVLAIAAAGSPSLGEDGVKIDKLRVLDSEFNEVAVIDDSSVLRSLEVLWQKMAPVEATADLSWSHKLDITSKDVGGRWLYSQDGYVARLNKEMKPRYRVSDNAAFLDLLGL